MATQGVRCLAFRPVNGACIRGVADLECIALGFVFYDCLLMLDRGGNYTVQLPTKRVKDGANWVHKATVSIRSQHVAAAFTAQALAAIQDFQEGQGGF